MNELLAYSHDELLLCLNFGLRESSKGPDNNSFHGS